MPKSYELKLREAEQRRRPRQKDELYKAVEGKPQKILIGWDHPETTMLEMILTWMEDCFTIDQSHEWLMAETHRLQREYNRMPLRANYSMKYVWFDRFIMRPRCQGRELILQDYEILEGYRLRIAAFFQGEKMWGMCNPNDTSKERPKELMDPLEDPNMLVRLDKGAPSPRKKLFMFTWLGGDSNGYKFVASKLPADWGVWVLEMPGHADREEDEGYPDGDFAVKMMTRTVGQLLSKQGGGEFYIYGHSQGSQFAFYTIHELYQTFGFKPKFFALSNFACPSAMGKVDVSTLRARNNLCVPLRIFHGLIKGGWGTDPKLGYKSYMGWQQYQHADLWPAARTVIQDHWITKVFPRPNCDQRLCCPIKVFYGEEDPAVSLDMVKEWKGYSSIPEFFEVEQMGGGHMWFQASSKRAEALANGLAKCAEKFR
mmetsp:Transcript_147056/g.273867  ORF Transcript_147056/g.273867 Transcript_147056/m.273867 type:complete len:428 (-) Transcript_147056:124-1407(-)